MLLQTNSYVVPRDKRVEHARLLRRFRQALLRLGCDHFEVYEQVGANWNTGEITGRYVQIMRFRDRKHQLLVQAAERNDPMTQALLREFCDLINFPYQQQQGLFAVGYYTSFLRMPSARMGDQTITESQPTEENVEAGSEVDQGVVEEQRISEEQPVSQDEVPAEESHSGETSAEETNSEEPTGESPENSDGPEMHHDEQIGGLSTQTGPEEPPLPYEAGSLTQPQQETDAEEDQGESAMRQMDLESEDPDEHTPFSRLDLSEESGEASAAVTDDVNGHEDDPHGHSEMK